MKLDELLALARQHQDLTDPNDPYPAELVGNLSRGIVELHEHGLLITEDEMLCLRDMITTGVVPKARETLSHNLFRRIDKAAISLEKKREGR